MWFFDSWIIQTFKHFKGIFFFSSFQFYCIVVRDCGLHAIDSLFLAASCFVPWLVYGHFLIHYVWNNIYSLIARCRIPYLYLYTFFSSVLLIVLFVYFIFLIFLVAYFIISEWDMLKSPNLAMNLLIFLCNHINFYIFKKLY